MEQKSRMRQTMESRETERRPCRNEGTGPVLPFVELGNGLAQASSHRDSICCARNKE